MKSRKILAAAMAGLCAISTMGVSAFATVVDETIATSGAKSYKVSAGFQAPTIDVTVPESVLGVINPYKIPVVIEGETFESEGVASPKYTITNNSTQVGINVKATYSAEGLDGVVATADAATTGNTDKKKLAYVTLNATSPLDITDLTACTPVTNDITPLVMDVTENATPAMLLRLDTKTAGNNEGKFWIGGDVIEEPAEKWSTADRLSINVVLDINPFNTGATGVVNTELGATGVTMTGTNGTYAITLSVAADSPAGKVITLTAPTGKTINNIVDTNTRNTVNVAAGTITLDTGIRDGDNSTITVTYDDASTATITLTINA